MTTKHELLDLAKEATADRGLNYGKPEDNFERVARRWRVHILNRFNIDVAIDAASVALMCDDLKTARLENDITHMDSWVDKAGYAACGAEIACPDKKPVTAELSAAYDRYWGATTRAEESAAVVDIEKAKKEAALREYVDIRRGSAPDWNWPDSVDDGA